MHYQVNTLSKTTKTFPSKSAFQSINTALGTLFEKAGAEAYELVEKYVNDAFEAEDLESFIQSLQTFAYRAEQEECQQLMNLLTEEQLTVLHDSPTKIPALQMEDASAYWWLNNIFGEVLPDQFPIIEAVALQFEVFGNGEDELFNSEDTGKYGDIYPFAVRLLMDATAEDSTIGNYELSGPLVAYFEQRKATSLQAVSSANAYDFDNYVDDAYGIIWEVNVVLEPEENEDGEERAIYEILVHQDWLSSDIKSKFTTFAYSEYL